MLLESLCALEADLGHIYRNAGIHVEEIWQIVEVEGSF